MQQCSECAVLCTRIRWHCPPGLWRPNTLNCLHARMMSGMIDTLARDEDEDEDARHTHHIIRTTKQGKNTLITPQKRDNHHPSQKCQSQHESLASLEGTVLGPVVRSATAAEGDPFKNEITQNRQTSTERTPAHPQRLLLGLCQCVCCLH